MYNLQLSGIRGTIPYFQVTKGNDGGFQQVTSMLKGEIAFTPKGANIPTLLGLPKFIDRCWTERSLLPPTLGKVPQSILTSIEAEIEASVE